MKAPSKILIAYDGSACSDAALQDLRRAGLPTAAEAVVLTAADVFLPPADEELPGGPAVRIPELERHTRERAEKAVNEARAFAERAAEQIKADFSDWRVKVEVDCDTPAWGVIKTAYRLGVDLIVVGAHRHSVAGGRLILGSTSQRVLYDAGRPVRVARCPDGRREGPVRIIVGFSGTPDAEEAINAVAARTWPEGSEARLVIAGHGPGRDSTSAAAGRLRAAGLSVSEFVREGDPAHVLIAEAEGWDADSIFVGTRGLHGFQHLLHGSVSAAVAAGARCSVEVVRAGRSAS